MDSMSFSGNWCWIGPYPRPVKPPTTSSRLLCSSVRFFSLPGKILINTSFDVGYRLNAPLEVSC
jgi:hypothetical protein